MDTRCCGCPLKCWEKVNEANRESLFKGFWEMASFDMQNAYLCACVKVIQVKRRYTEGSSRRSHSRVYYVHNGHVSVRVCKVAFLRIHGISNGRLTRVLKGQELGGVPKCDQRGRHEPVNKTREEDIDFVKQHVESFPQYQSHYSRESNPNRKYLSPDLNLIKMYELYKKACADADRQPISDWVYRRVFNEDFNLAFGRYVLALFLLVYFFESHSFPLTLIILTIALLLLW